MTLEYILNKISKIGWEFSLQWENNHAIFIIWKPEWVTSNLYAARICPSFQEPSLSAAVLAGLFYIVFNKD